MKALDLFGESVELAYDDAVYLASLICGTPMSMVSVLEETQRFKAKIGIEATETPKEESFCIHAIQQDGLFVVPNAQLDSRFRDLPLVTGNPNLRFYAGMPLATVQGDAVGALCVCDTVPRSLTEDQKSALTVLSRQVAARFHDREKMVRMAQIIAEKEKAENELRSSHALFMAFMDNSPLLSYMKDKDGYFVYYNRTFMDHFHVTANEWIGLDERAFFPEEDGKRLVEMDREIFLSDQLSVLETTVPGPGGTQNIWKSYKFNFVNAAGEQFLAALAHEITAEKEARREVERYHSELRKANERLRELSLTDPLTGCWNRRAFEERLASEFATCKRHGGVLSILMLDIDNFKKINDQYGHETGDQVICRVAKVLKDGARGSDMVCRYGGEEFAVLLPRTPREGAAMIAERLRAAVGAKWDGTPVTVSIGIGNLSENCDSATVVRHADEALYAAKAAGKNRVALAA